MASAFFKAAVSALLLSQGRVYAAAPAAANAAAPAVASGDFSILTFNIAGLPAFMQDNGGTGDKTISARLIGELCNKYNFDVVHLQEDFNYHAALYSTAKQPYRTATSGGAIIGSGLNTLSNFPWLNFERRTWDMCSDETGADCLTPKGFTVMRVQISPVTNANPNTATFVDVYNLHADAGVSDDDLLSRSSNLQELLDWSKTWSAGNAVLIFGDTNSRYTREQDRGLRALLQAGYTDAWMQHALDGVMPADEVLCNNPQPTGNTTCETVDKVLYKSGPLVTLNATWFEYVGTWFLDANKGPLSDHNPVTVNFAWTASAKLQQSGFWGGPHGVWFSDVETLDALAKPPVVATLEFRGDARLDSVGVTLRDGTRLVHGGTGGTLAVYTMEEGEYWKSAMLCQGKGKLRLTTRNYYIIATMSSGRFVSAGSSTGDCATFEAPAGWAIVGFVGQSGDEVDQLAFVYAPL